MNKLINWTLGSFFRTLGRILVYILLGFLLCYLFKDLKLPNLFTILDVRAETFTNNTYMTWQLNKNGTRLNSGNNPFYTSVENLTDYGNYDLYLFYNNYTAYTNYYYDVALTIYYDNPFIFANKVRECNIYIEGSTNQTSDGCRVVEYTNTSLKIVNYNIRSQNGTGTFTSQFITPVYQNNEYTAFQVNSFKLEIIAKEDKSITSEIFDSGINTIIDNQNANTQREITAIDANTSAINNVAEEARNNTQSIIDNQNQNKNDIINNQNNSDSSQATNDASNFFSNFTTDTHGLTGIITAPLNAIQSLSSKQCSPLVLPLPFLNQNLILPCMRDIYTQYFGDFMILYDIITLGIISYWVMVRIFGLVKDFKNPEHDEIEVLDL